MFKFFNLVVTILNSERELNQLKRKEQNQHKTIQAINLRITLLQQISQKEESNGNT